MEKLILALAFLSLAACTHGQCNNVPQRDKAAAESAIINSSGKAEDTVTVQVYKETGEKQCGQQAGSHIDKVKEILIKNKITVLDAKTQDDGMMHIQVCGAPTGQIHVFSIPKASAKRALGLGFKAFNRY